MGSVTSRINFDSIHRSRGGSQQNEPLYSYSLNKNHFCNHFLMGGERFEVNDPDYLFGDNCDLNFLSCTKPYSLPYKKAQQSLLSNLNAKHKVGSKVSSCVGVSLASPLQILTGRHRPISRCRKQDAQTQTLNESDKSSTNGTKPSQPLIMLINIRKETLRLVRSTNFYNVDSDLNSLSQNQSPIQTAPTPLDLTNNIEHQTQTHNRMHTSLTGPTSSKKNKALKQVANNPLTNTNRHSTNSSQTTTTATMHMDESDTTYKNPPKVHSSRRADFYKKKGNQDSDTTSNISSPISTNPSAGDEDDSSSGTESSRSGYTSVKGVPPSCAASSDDENFVDALNDTSNLSSSRDEADDNESERAQQRKSLLSKTTITKENREAIIPITDSSSDANLDVRSDDGESVRITSLHLRGVGERGVLYFKHNTSADGQRGQTSNKSHNQTLGKRLSTDNQLLVNRVYNIEFQFDTEVDCSIRIFYFCTREVNSNGVTYKPQHATYKSKTYIYKKGLNQKFEQQEHTFQPYLFDEDLLIYKPLDLEGNYNSGAVFPIVIHCVALDGPQPRQSQSLVATVEKSQLDESYSIKPLKQLIFVDGVQYILQDIYGIENKHFHQPQQMEVTQSKSSKQQANSKSSKSLERSTNINPSLRSSMISIGSNNLQHLSDTASIASGLIVNGRALCEYDEDDDEADLERDGNHNEGAVDYRGSLASVASVNNQQQLRSLTSENHSFECVICMSEERDTMLLPCRHLCLCSSCAQSLRYQANSCPICRRPFKAALNLRIIQSKSNKLRRRNRHRYRASENRSYGVSQD